MTHQPSLGPAALVAALVAALGMTLPQAACTPGLHADRSPHQAPTAESSSVSVYLPSQYPAPQGEIEVLPPQF